MKLIPLTRGQSTIIDDDDFIKINQYKWYANWDKHTKSFYAMHRDKTHIDKKMQSMHRFIMGLEIGDTRQVDHINHNTLDNRKENLRIVTRRINQHNRKYNSKFGYCIGYTPKLNHARPFDVRITKNKKVTRVGHYETWFDAIIARDAWMHKHL